MTPDGVRPAMDEGVEHPIDKVAGRWAAGGRLGEGDDAAEAAHGVMNCSGWRTIRRRLDRRDAPASVGTPLAMPCGRRSVRDVARHVFACGMSRSGTTLLTTILDSHDQISMGYELLPSGLGEARSIGATIRAAATRVPADGKSIADVLRSEDDTRSLGTFVRRCERTLVTPEELSGICDRLADESADETFDSLPLRARLSMAVVEVKMAKEKAALCGFKLNAPSIDDIDRLFPDSRFIAITRDPRDVVASHFEKGFNRTIEHICRAWVNYTGRFLAFRDRCPERATLVRYEDLVREPDANLDAIFDCIGLPYGDEVRAFYQSKASVHQTGHVNAELLARDFFTTSVGRWQTQLSVEQIREVEDACGDVMERLGYDLAPLEPLVSHQGTARYRKFTDNTIRRSKFYRDHYGELVGPYTHLTNLTWAEAAIGEKSPGADILILRHDVDHDYETALRMGRWEHEHGLRATYCILHTAWYYGELIDGRQQRTREMLDCCLELQDLGHEINVHNNFPVVALKTGLDAIRLLEQELAFYRLHGVKISGTSTHGDALCRELNFRNYELFRESVYELRGGPRVVEHDGNRVALGHVSMHDFGLAYEAYDLPRDLYFTDSGGTLRRRTNTRGRAGLRRREMDPGPAYPDITGILTHPIWWDFTRDSPPGQTLPEV